MRAGRKGGRVNGLASEDWESYGQGSGRGSGGGQSKVTTWRPKGIKSVDLYHG